MDQRCQAVAQMLIHSSWPGVSEIIVVLYACRSWCCSLSSSLWQWPVLLAIISGCPEITFVTGTLAFLVSVSVFLTELVCCSCRALSSLHAGRHCRFSQQTVYTIQSVTVSYPRWPQCWSSFWQPTMTTYIEWMHQWSLACLTAPVVSWVVFSRVRHERIDSATLLKITVHVHSPAFSLLLSFS